MSDLASPPLAPTRYIQLDEDGYFLNAGVRYTDAAFGADLLRHLRYDNKTLLTESDGQLVLVEAFSEPLVARHVHGPQENIAIQLEFPYGIRTDLNFSQLFVDEWDRFRGFTTLPSGAVLPYVLSRAAQADLFELAEEFDDDSITVAGQTHTIKPWYAPADSVSDSNFWSTLYANWKDDATKPGWEQKEAAAPLRDISSQLKLNKSRMIVLGCGSGHDAAFFAQLGHFVTAVDFSADALSLAQKNYGHIKNLQFKKADVFDLPAEMKGQFDIVFDHTFLCAIDPSRRAEIVKKVYKPLLADQGHLLGIFLVLPPNSGPPFGMTEWELRELLKGRFHSLYWTRWRKSIERRAGKELVVYAQVKNM